jgi:glycosyltransferase involved in cell wall biosynthesis
MRFAFVLEQTLGHGAHSRNLKRALEAETWIDATVIELTYEAASRPLRDLPLLSNWSFRSSLAARNALRARLRRGPLDAIFVHTQVASMLLGGLMRTVPTVISLDATPKNFDAVGASYGHVTRSRAVEFAKAAVARRAFHSAAELVTWNRWAAESLVSDYSVPRGKIHVIPPGVDLELFQPRADQPRQEPIRVLFVGADFTRKGGSDLLSAMALLDSAEVDIVTSEARIDVPQGVVCRVHRGLSPQSAELLSLYRGADIFALPSRGDCLPQALAEAAASGLPLIATRSGAMSEVVQHGVNGFRVAEASPRDLAAALRRLIADAPLRREFGASARRLAERDHDAARNDRSIFDLMRLAAEKRRAAQPAPASAVMDRT